MLKDETEKTRRLDGEDERKEKKERKKKEKNNRINCLLTRVSKTYIKIGHQNPNLRIDNMHYI